MLNGIVLLPTCALPLSVPRRNLSACILGDPLPPSVRQVRAPAPRATSDHCFREFRHPAVACGRTRKGVR